MRVPMLCYHRIEVPPVGAERDTNFVTPTQFAEQLDWLKQRGFTGVTVRDVLAWQRGERALPAKPVAITFDDGYSSVEEQALPLLERHQWRCTVFAVTGYLGRTNVWDPHAPSTTLLDAAALRALLAAGHDVGAHTRHHRRVRGLDAAAAREELADARMDLESALGTSCQTIAFPYGSHDRVTLSRVKDAGYAGAVTLKRWANGRSTNPFRLGRLSVGGPLPLWQFAAKLAKLSLTPSFA
jgi:peptidoglycan/xylan/chitin deacetylase (PgdA/CDA1 family)